MPKKQQNLSNHLTMALLASLIPNQLAKMSSSAELGTKLTTFASCIAPYLFNFEFLLQINYKEQPPKT
jgi:hypothetical protein